MPLSRRDAIFQQQPLDGSGHTPAHKIIQYAAVLLGHDADCTPVGHAHYF